MENSDLEKVLINFHKCMRVQVYIYFIIMLQILVGVTGQDAPSVLAAREALTGPPAGPEHLSRAPCHVSETSWNLYAVSPVDISRFSLFIKHTPEKSSC